MCPLINLSLAKVSVSELTLVCCFLLMKSCSVVGRPEVACDQFHCKMMRNFAYLSFKHNFFMYVYNYFLQFCLFSAAAPLSRQLR